MSTVRRTSEAHGQSPDRGVLPAAAVFGFCVGFRFGALPKANRMVSQTPKSNLSFFGSNVDMSTIKILVSASCVQIRVQAGLKTKLGFEGIYMSRNRY